MKEKKKFYNILRQNWRNNPSINVEPWQIEDYSTLSIERLLERLDYLGIRLTIEEFCREAHLVDTPEELATVVEQKFSLPEEIQDPAYLLLFTLWTKLLPEKRPLSIVSNELDTLITAYDEHTLASTEPIQDALANLLLLLAEYRDKGQNPQELFACITSNCAQSFETFLYDYICDLIESSNDRYATELLDDFTPYVSDTIWFDFLRFRLLAKEDPETSEIRLESLLRKAKREGDLDLQLEILSLLVQNGDRKTFRKIAKAAIPLLKNEEHFQDLLYISSDFFHCTDEEEKEKRIEALLQKRKKIAPQSPLKPNDTDLSSFLKLMRN